MSSRPIDPLSAEPDGPTPTPDDPSEATATDPGSPDARGPGREWKGRERGGRTIERLRRVLTRSLAQPFTEGNRVRSLRNGKEIFPAMLGAIASAERSIELETFIYWRGGIAYDMAQSLADAAGRGVEVRVLLDAAGCHPMADEIRSILETSAAEVGEFGELRPWRFWKLDHRTHRKILVCDGEVGFTGGVGIAEEWEGDARHPGEWRETHFQVEGPVVQGMRGAFLSHWLSAKEYRVGFPAALPPARRDPGEELEDGRSQIQLVPSLGSGRWSNAQTLFRVLIQAAQESLKITTAYFTPEDELVALLKDAAERGVEVDILVPGEHIDHRVSQLAGEEYYPELLRAGVRLWRYRPTMLHAKIVIVDGVVSCVGSANLNYRSALKDDEINLCILDPALARNLLYDFERDLGRALAVTEEDAGRDRSIPRRVLSKLAHLGRREL